MKINRKLDIEPRSEKLSEKEVKDEFEFFFFLRSDYCFIIE